MSVNATKLVKDLALEIPMATNIFEQFGIDYCCGGKKSLQEACSSIGVSTDRVVELLDKASQADETPKEFNDWREEKLSSLISYILDKHHTYIRTQSPNLIALLAKVTNKHGERHTELYLVQKYFTELVEELNPHLYKEENILFPYVLSLEKAKEQKQVFARPPFGTVSNPINVMLFEHDNAGAILKEMRKAAKNYIVPEDGCTSFALLYKGLEAFEGDLHRHIHLENNLLFPKAIELEKE